MGIKITVAMKEMKFAEALARGMAEKSKQIGMIIQCARLSDIRDDVDIVITDCKTLEKRDGLKYQEIVIEGYSVNVEEVLEKIYRMTETDVRNGTFCGEKRARMIGFFSPFGSGGTTGIAISVGRILSGAYGENCLYISMSGDAEEENYVCIHGSRRRSKELIFRLRKNLPVLWMQYVFKDDYGLDFMELWPVEFYEKQTENIDRLWEDLEKVAELGTYSWIILDFGKNPPKNECHINVKIKNMADSRSGADSGGDNHGYITVLNRSEESSLHEIEGCYSIPEDREGFIYDRERGTIEISLSGNFGRAVRILTENIYSYEDGDGELKENMST